jgi:sugar phosphate isomerase/epimerase
MISRRNFMKAGAALGVVTAAGETASATSTQSSSTAAAASLTGDRYTGGGMGVASTSLAIRLGGYGHKGSPLKDDSIAYLEYCHSIGAIGVQMTVKGDIAKFRKRAEDLNMFIEYEGRLPENPAGDLSGLEKAMQDAIAVGATTMRVVSTGKRRYETFKTLAEFKQAEKDHAAVVEKIVPIAEKYKVILAMENHKDRTADEFAALLKHISSEYYGSLVDFGNNISLSEEPMEVVRKLAPYAKSMHLKDMAVKRYEEGFLLSEVPCGQGFLDMKGMVALCRRANPKVMLSLEMITDHVLKVPVNTDVYWATFPERRATAQPAILKLVDEYASQTMPQTAGLSEEGLLSREEENNRLSLVWGRANLAVSWLA